MTSLARSADNGDPPLDLSLNVVEKKNVSMVALKREEADRKKMLRRAEQEADMLADFVRLADYIAVQALVQLVESTMQVFLLELQKPRKQGMNTTHPGRSFIRR